MSNKGQHFFTDITDFEQHVPKATDRQSDDNGDGTNFVCGFDFDDPTHKLDPIQTLYPIWGINYGVTRTGMDALSIDKTFNEAEHQRAQRLDCERVDDGGGGVWNANNSTHNDIDHRIFDISDETSALPLFPLSFDDVSTTNPELALLESGTIHVRRRDSSENGTIFLPNRSVEGENDYLPYHDEIKDSGSIATCDLVTKDAFQRTVTPSLRDPECSIQYEDKIDIVADRLLNNTLTFEEDREGDVTDKSESLSCGEYDIGTTSASVSNKSVLYHEDEGEDDDIVNRIFADKKQDVAVDELLGMVDNSVIVGDNKNLLAYDTQNNSLQGVDYIGKDFISAKDNNFLSIEEQMECESFLNEILNNSLCRVHADTTMVENTPHPHKNKNSTEEWAQWKEDKARILPPGKVYRIVRRPLKQLLPPKLKTKEDQQPEHDSSIVTDTNEQLNAMIKTPDDEIRPSDEVSPKGVKSVAHRTIFTYKTWDGTKNCWRHTKTFTTRSGPKINRCDKDEDHSYTAYHYRIPLSRGGELNIFPNLIEAKQVNSVKKELLKSTFWRKYSIQGGDEPRLHFLAHNDATEEFENEAQPGYRYANTTMKARPLSSLPRLQQLSEDLASLRKIPDEKWSIGVHPVVYRDGKDSMGDHADDDQGETVIFCVMLDSPAKARKVVVKVFDKLTGGRRGRDRVYQDGDEFIELLLQPGDAYEMNGLMQESYSHCVPKDADTYDNPITEKNNKTEKCRRMCVVLRTGDQKSFENDTGEACNDLSPRLPLTYRFGHVQGLEEGTMYTRRELKKINAFQCSQRGISGSYRYGADAIIVSGKRCGEDDFEKLHYIAEWRIGGNALLKSFAQQSTIRVFRSESYILNHSKLRRETITTWDRRGSSKLYRYDGLYKIAGFTPPLGRSDSNGVFEFFLTRLSTPYVPNLSFDNAVNDLFQTSTKRSLDKIEMPYTKSNQYDSGPYDWSCFGNLLLLRSPPLKSLFGAEHYQQVQTQQQHSGTSTTKEIPSIDTLRPRSDAGVSPSNEGVAAKRRAENRKQDAEGAARYNQGGRHDRIGVTLNGTEAEQRKTKSIAIPERLEPLEDGTAGIDLLARASTRQERASERPENPDHATAGIDLLARASIQRERGLEESTDPEAVGRRLSKDASPSASLPRERPPRRDGTALPPISWWSSCAETAAFPAVVDPFGKTPGSILETPPVSASSKKKKEPTASKKRMRSVGSSSSANAKGRSSGRWTREEQQALDEGLAEFGRDWKKIAARIPTRTHKQITDKGCYFARRQRVRKSSASIASTGSVRQNLPTAPGTNWRPYRNPNDDDEVGAIRSRCHRETR